jgi:GTP pyrophosphokinase
MTMNISGVLDSLPARFAPKDHELIQRAFQVASEAHKGQKRASGEPYINHCLAVAQILAEMHVPPVVIAAGLLHDTVEDTNLTLPATPASSSRWARRISFETPSALR